MEGLTKGNGLTATCMATGSINGKTVDCTKESILTTRNMEMAAMFGQMVAST